MFILMGILWVVFIGLPTAMCRMAYLNTLEDELYRKALMSKELKPCAKMEDVFSNYKQPQWNSPAEEQAGIPQGKGV